MLVVTHCGFSTERKPGSQRDRHLPEIGGAWTETAELSRSEFPMDLDLETNDAAGQDIS